MYLMLKPGIHPARSPVGSRWRDRCGMQGGSLVDALLSLLLFSVGMLALLKLLSSALAESANAQYRNEASQLASALVARMWTGDRSVGSLQSRFGDVNASDYQAWLADVQSRLPGTGTAAMQPIVSIDAQRHVAITLYWKAPADRHPHQLQVQAMIAD